MSFTKSTLPTNTISSLADKPTESAIQLKAKFDLYSAGDVPYINTLIDELESVTAGSDIGTNAPSITAENITDALEENRLLINTNTTADGQNVKLTGNQTVAGTKTFSSLPTIPETPSADTDAASKGYVDSQSPLTIPNDSITNIKMASDVKIGSLATLLTTIKTSVTNAINEIFGYSLTPKQTGGGYLINGDFGINQRAVSGTVVLAQDEYGHDRFKGGASGCTYTFASSGGVTTLTISAGSLIQEIEGENLDSDTYVLSWDGTAQGKIGSGAFSDSGVTGAVTGGTDLAIELNTGTLTKCKFEIGIVPTLFIHNLFNTEKNIGKYYTQKISPSSNNTRFGLGQAANATTCNIQIPILEMRATPTLVSNGNFELATGASTIAVTSLAFSKITESVVLIVATTAGGLTAGNVYSLKDDADITAYLLLDAEL